MEDEETIVGTTLKRYDGKSDDELSFAVGCTLFISADFDEDEDNPMWFGQIMEVLSSQN